jgi:DNA-binding beta-propeller fold protein YncE
MAKSPRTLTIVVLSLLGIAILQGGPAAAKPSTLPPATSLAAKSRSPAQPTASVADDPAALGGYDVLIADRGNNRLLLVSPQKQILWQYDFQGLAHADGADDAFFIQGGKSVIVNLEHDQVIEMIDRASKAVTWSYGTLGRRGYQQGLLDFPDDAYKLPNGDVMVADIRNCRILEIAPDKSIVRQAGRTRRCGSGPDEFASPNGDTPLPDGSVLVSTIGDHSLIKLDRQWRRVFKLSLPLHYPSDPQPTKAGNYVIADYVRHGRIIEIDQQGNIVWEFDGNGQGGLDRPSLAEELPNGNIIANDDLNHRVIVIDKASKRIVWQYGITGHHGSGPGELSIPDGIDIIAEECIGWLAPMCQAGVLASSSSPR